MARLYFFTSYYVTAACLSTIVLAAPRPALTNKATKNEKPVELKSSKRLIFGTENGLSISDCGELGNTTQRKHFSWDVKIKFGNRTCNGVFISHQTVLTSSSCYNATSHDTLVNIKMENSSKINASSSSMMKLFGDNKSSLFSFAIVNLMEAVKNVSPICLWNFKPKISASTQYQHYKVSSLKKQRLKVPASIAKSDKCSFAKAFANKNHTHGNILCTRVRREHEKIQGEGFLIKRIGKRWFLRGIPLRKTNLGDQKFNAFHDIFPHLRWIAENSKGINALPEVPKAAKSYVFNSGEENLSSPDCGQIMKADDEKSTTAYQVYNGRTSVNGEHPWFALVEVYFENGTVKSCGGTLIKENVVLTAAHCVVFMGIKVSVNLTSVTLGIHDVNDVSDETMKYQAEAEPIEIVVHQNYENFKSDIALLIFKDNFKRNHRASPLCLWNRGGDLHSIVNLTGTIVGLGTIGTSKNNTVIMPNQLQRADMPVLSYKKCSQTGNSDTFKNHLVPGENFCAGYQNGTTACKGDSGGGFAINVDGRWFLRGVLSFGVADNNRCFSNYNVFLDIVKYIPWIMENIQQWS